jgi:hypothetical protein
MFICSRVLPGTEPIAMPPVVLDAAGNLFGTAFDGWNTGCCGVVFEYMK